MTAYLYQWKFMTCFQFNESGSFSNYCFTDAAWPIRADFMQLDAGAAQPVGIFNRAGGFDSGLTFLPEVLSVDKLGYGIGFEDKPAEISWAIADDIDYQAGFLRAGQFTSPGHVLSPALLTLKQAFLYGMFSEAPFWIHQAVYDDFPANGGSFLGTTLMFRGYLRGVSGTRSLLKLRLASLLDAFQGTQVPTQTMTPNNRALPYVPAAVSAYGADFSAIVAVGEQVLEFTTNEAIPENAMQDSWLIFNPATGAGAEAYTSGTPSAAPFRIQGNTATTGGSPQTVRVYFYETVVLPLLVSTISVYAQLTSSGGAPGFPDLPPPEFSA